MDFKDLAPFFPLIAATVVTTLISAVGLWVSRRLGLTPAQAKYVETLEGFNDTLEKKIEFIEGEMSDKEAAIVEMQKQLDANGIIMRAQEQTIFELRTELATRPKRRLPRLPEADEK